MKQRSNCSTSSCEMSSRNGKCRRGSGAKPKPNSPSCSTEGSSRHDGQPGLAHEISDSPAPPPAAQGRHVGLDPGLVDEDEPSRLNPTLTGLPARPLAGDVGPHLLGRPHGFFEAQS